MELIPAPLALVPAPERDELGAVDVEGAPGAAVAERGSSGGGVLCVAILSSLPFDRSRRSGAILM